MKSWVVPCLLIAALLKPSGLETIPWLEPFDYLFTGLQITALLFALWVYLHQPISKILVASIALFLLYAGFTLMRGNVSSLVSSDSLSMIKMIVVIMIVEPYVYRGNTRVLLRGFTYAAVVLLAVNLVMTFVVNPGGLYGAFSEGGECFLGNKNIVRNPLMLGFVCSVLLDALDRKKTSRRTIGLIVLGFASLALVWSVTPLVIFAATCFLYFLTVVNVRVLPNIKAFGLAAAVSWFAVVVFRKIDFVQHFVVDILGKDMTFSGRTTIWDSAFGTIASSPIVGQGFGSTITWWNEYNPLLQVSHCHNAFVDVLYKGGAFGLAAFLVLIMVSCSKLGTVSNQHIVACLTIAIAAFLFMGIFGELFNPCFVAVLALAYCANAIEKEVRT